MDNITHSLVGWAMGRTLPHARWGPWVAPVAIVSANLPDFETFFTPRADKADYLIHHRGWGHSFLGVAGETLLLATVVWAMGRWLGHRFAEGERPTFWRAMAVIAPCALSHLLLDWWNTYGVRPFYPFDTGWYHGDMVFIIDGWIWLLLLATLGFGTRWKRCEPMSAHAAPYRHTPVALVALTGLFMAVIVALTSLGGLVPMGVGVVWFTLAGTLVALRRWAMPWPRPRFWATVGLSILTAYVLSLAAMNRTAHTIGLDEHARLKRPDVVDSSANPIPGIPWRYEVLVETRSTVYRYSVHAAQRRVLGESSMSNHLDDPRLQEIAHTKAYRAWQGFARHPVVRDEQGVLWLGDARYGLNPKRPDWSALPVPEP